VVDMTDSLNTSNPADSAILAKLLDLVGEQFATKIATDSSWAREVVGIGPTDS